MKYIGAYCFPAANISRILKETLGDKHNSHNQFRIVCKARGVKHANELTAWVAHKAFEYGFCNETGNEQELSFFGKDSKVTFIIRGTFNRYITDIELKELLKGE